jgi:hypothetical protein
VPKIFDVGSIDPAEGHRNVRRFEMEHYGIIRKVGNDDAKVEVTAAVTGQLKVTVFPENGPPVAAADVPVDADGFARSPDLMGHVGPTGKALIKTQFVNGSEAVVLRQRSGVNILLSEKALNANFRFPVGSVNQAGWLLIANPTGQQFIVKVQVGNAAPIDVPLLPTQVAEVALQADSTVRAFSPSSVPFLAQVTFDLQGNRQEGIVLLPSA